MPVLMVTPDSNTVAAQNIGPLEHVCWVRKGYVLGSEALVKCLQRLNIWC